MSDNQKLALIVVMRMAAGNPGAMNCLIGMINQCEPEITQDIFTTLAELDIKGTDIYVLWSDLCDKDYTKMWFLTQNCPADILKDACSRQDWSGVELVKPYL